MSDYSKRIACLIEKFPIPIDTGIKIEERCPTAATSEFLTNKEQGDWAERLVKQTVLESASEYLAVSYGCSESISAGDPGFAAFFGSYVEELNKIGKRPDILIFRKKDIGFKEPSANDLENLEFVSKAVAAIEVRSSSFLLKKYNQYMQNRTESAQKLCSFTLNRILCEPYRSLLAEKSPVVFKLLSDTPAENFKELDFRASSWSSTAELRELSQLLKKLKEQIKILHKRDYLSITPKLEDIALVNRWIQLFNVPHYYLQVFFDQAFIIPFEKILEISSNPELENICFSVEQDVKNQGKTTIKINVEQGEPIIGKIDMPQHHSAMKELDRGRLLFYVQFDGGKGYLDLQLFNKLVSYGRTFK